MLIIEIEEGFPFFFSQCFLNKTRNTFTVFLWGYRKAIERSKAPLKQGLLVLVKLMFKSCVRLILDIVRHDLLRDQATAALVHDSFATHEKL